MTSLAQLRKAALAQPGTDETRDGRDVSFDVGGSVFATCSTGVATLRLTEADADSLVEQEPATRVAGGAEIALADINGMALNYWVRRAWEAHAEEDSRPGAGSDEVDLPRSIGRPATSALVGAGVTDLAGVAALTEAELLDLHGIGPKAVGVLVDALDEQGLALREDDD